MNEPLELDLTMPSWYLRLSGPVRGFWRRELVVLLASFGLGMAVGLLR